VSVELPHQWLLADMTMWRPLCTLPLALALFSPYGAALAQTFKFSAAEEAQKKEQADKQAAQDAKVQDMLAAPCLEKIKNKKIVVLVGESRNGVTQASQGSYSAHFDAINSRLRKLGLRTYTQAQIRAQIAQAEIDAFFRNDPDAALSASRRLSAQYMIRGLISTQASRNAVVNLNQVHVGMDFTLSGGNGRVVSQARVENASYAGADISGVALTLIEERADEVVAKLYSDYCRKEGSR